MIDAALLDELRSRVPVSAVVGRRVKLRKAGREWKGLSPFNPERTPSFFVNDQKQFWHDFSSGKHGGVFAFVAETEGVGFREAVDRVATMAGMATKLKDSPPPPPAEPPPREPDAEELQEKGDRLRVAQQLWRRSLSANSTIGEMYLRARGYHAPIPATLRYLPASGVYPPALIAAYGMATEPEPGTIAIADDAVVGVHLIKLKPDGSDRLRDDPKCKITIGKGIAAPSYWRLRMTGSQSILPRASRTRSTPIRQAGAVRGLPEAQRVCLSWLISSRATSRA
jgi:hypothetical protein